MASIPLRTKETSTTVAALLGFVPESERRDLLNKLIGSLRARDNSSIDIVASLVAREPNEDVKNDFLLFLEQSVRTGEIDSVIRVCSEHQDLRKDLLERVLKQISQVKLTLEHGPAADDALLSYLAFFESAVFRLLLTNHLTEVFESSLELLLTEREDISQAALHVVLAVLAIPDDGHRQPVYRPRCDAIWRTIHDLVVSSCNSHALRGYTLWLRYLLSRPQEFHADLITSGYWALLLHGLRRGDSERRKLCLGIIKLSITADIGAVPDDRRPQYERFCTVFETIVLGRYINQIQECEYDLNALAKNQNSEVKWLYVLLASGLDVEMQESNRKFIGKWTMRSNLAACPEFLDFFRDDFLPWAVQGSLYVSTLKMHHGVPRCSHGDALTKFIKQSRGNGSLDIVNIIVETIHKRRNTIFAYAVVYLLEGIGDHLQSSHVSQIAQVKALPEVARDYIKLKASGLGVHVPAPKAPSRREAMEQTALHKCHTFNSTSTALEDIWTDLEYLEYPKKLLMVLPQAIFNLDMIRKAREDPELATNLDGKLRALQNISFRKVYFFTPLVKTIRQAILSDTKAASILPISDFIIRIAETPPEPSIDLMLEEATLSLTPFSYNYYFGDRPGYGFAALLDLISRLKDHQELIEALLNHFLSKWRAQKPHPPTVSAWKNTLQLQILLLCFEQYNTGPSARTLDLIEDLLYILAIEPLPRYRYLLEAMVVRFILRHGLEDSIIERLRSKDHHSNPKHLASLMKIGTILASREHASMEFAIQLATTFVPLAASSKVVIRHEAQWQVPILMDHARAKEWSIITDNPAFVALETYIRSLERFSDPPIERRIGRFNPETDITLSNLVEGLWFELDNMETPLTTYDDFFNLYQEELPPDAPKPCIPLGDKIVRQDIYPKESPFSSSATTSNGGLRTVIEASALQTKGTAYLARTTSDLKSNTSRPNDLIVVGSLVDNPYNLGGLSRVSEIFGASALTLQNQNVLSNKDFTSVSVSSHLHFSIVQLSAIGVPTFLAERKQEGFTVVGIEQTDRSVVLGSEGAKLPKKVVLVVGSEREGIPAVVLTECDLLVEIPQQGVTRSLNVQTAVGIVLYEYARQHRR